MKVNKKTFNTNYKFEIIDDISILSLVPNHNLNLILTD